MSDVSDQRKYYERMMDEVGAEYRRRIADLQAENDKLREELDAAKHDLSVFSGEIVASKAENAKLRELVAEMMIALHEYAEKAQSENAKLPDENARLRSCLSDDADNARQIMAENAKLRELVRDAWGDGHPDRSCDGCDIRDECHDDVERMRKDGVLRFSRCLFELRIEERMRELGIEVD